MALNYFPEKYYLSELLSVLQTPFSEELKISVLSDPHYFAPSLGTSGAAFEAYLAQDRKMIAESDAILQSALDIVKSENPDILLVPGDLTKDGEKLSHEAVAAYLADLESTGVKVYVIPGNHDVNNPHAMSYSGDTETPVDSVSPEEFAAIYSDFGYGEALYRDPNSLSYVAEVSDKLWILGIDSCEYDTNIADGSPETDGSLSAETRSWVLEKLAEAKVQGITVIGMMHHNLVEHYSLQEDLFGDYVIDDGENLAKELAGAGLGMIFTGHYHANDIVKVTDSGLYEIETGSLVTWPSPVRTVTINGDGSVSVTSASVTEIDYDLGGAASFEAYATDYLMTGLVQLATYYLMATFGVTQAVAASVAPLFADAMSAHYMGDEAPDATTLATIQAMAASGDTMQMQLAGALQSLWTDFSPADNTATVSFTDFWSDKTTDDLKQILADSYSLTPQQHYELYGEVMKINTSEHVLIGSIALPGSEITAYDSNTKTAFVIGGSDQMYVVSLADPSNPVLVETVQLAGKAQSVAVNADGLIAVAVDQEGSVDDVRENGSTATYHADGLVQFFNYDGVTVSEAGQVTVGSLPDSLVFNDDGTVLVTANEGEPNQFYGTDDDSMDPVGSISIINIDAADPAESVVTTLGFEAWNGQLELLRNKGIRISGEDAADGIDGNLVAQDIEPEYVTISGDKAYVTLQENNAIAVVDLATKEITDIFSAGLKDWGLGTPEATSYEFSIDYPDERPDFDGDGVVDDGEVVAGGLSGLWYSGTETIGETEFEIYYAITDRSPQAASIGDREGDNPADPNLGGKIFDDPDYPITIYKLGKADGQVIQLESTTLKVPDGEGGFRDATGIGMLDRNDAAYQLTGQDVDGYNVYEEIPKDQFGLDTESVACLTIDGLNDGNPVFAVADEYGPQIAFFDAATGNMIKRIVPSGTDFESASNIGYADIPEYTSETLPEIYSTINNNRGFEAMAFNSDDGLLYAFIQSPLKPAGYENQEIIRIVAVDPLSGAAEHEYLYALTGEKGQDKIGDAVYDAENGVFYVIERDSGTSVIANKSIFEIDLSDATDTLAYTTGADGHSWEELLGAGVTQPELADVESLADLLAGEVVFVQKTELLNIPSLGADPRFDKTEGLALKPDGSLVVAYDNDFVHVDGRADNVLTEITFTDLLVDTTDEDDAIDPGVRDFLGMRMPDGIDAYQYDGETFLVFANEGDGRVRPDEVNFEVDEAYDGAFLKIVSELAGGETVVETLTDPLTGNDIFVIVSDETDPDAHEVEDGDEYFLSMEYGWSSDDEFYSDETRLYKLDDSYKKGDEIGRLKVVNTETDGDPIIAFGGRSMSIMDSKGNIVYDSGDLIEQAAIAAGVYDDDRSDDKGTEPENVTLAEVEGHIYAYVALERVNSIAVFDVTNPYDVEFLELIDVKGGTGFESPEGLASGDGYLIVSNEVTTGLAIYALPDTPMVGEEIPDMVVAEDSTLFARVLSNTFTDSEEGDTLTYTATLANGDPLPDWLHFDASSHSIETMEEYFLEGGSSEKATDSASAITAMVTGQKTDAGNISWASGDPAGGELTTIAETLRADYGFAIGVGSTVEFSHATPAGVVSHDTSRNHKWDIADEILSETKPEVVIGAGFDSYFAKAVKDAAGNDADQDNNGYNDQYDAFHNGEVTDYTENVVFVEREANVDGGDALSAAAASVSLADGERLFGLFGTEEGHFEYYNVYDTPSIATITRSTGDATPSVDEDPTMAEMANAALTVLNQDEDGFFVMFEQGDIDWSNHANDYEAMIGGVHDLDLGVTEVENYVASGDNGIDWSNTLLIVTSDHSNSYMRNESVLGIGDLGEVGTDVTYASDGHTNELVTVSARGAGATYFGELAGDIYAGTSIIDNTQIYDAMLNAAENAGAEHIILMIGDGMNIEHEIAASRYLYGEDFGLSWNDWGTLEDGWTGYATTWDVDSYNTYAGLNGVAEYDPATYDPLIGYDPAQGGTTPYPVAMTFTGTPDNEDVGTLDIMVTATDKDGAYATQTFTLTVEDNVAPTVTSFDPADDATGVAIDETITFEFSEAIQFVDETGVVLHEGSVDGTVVDADVSVTGSTLMVDPTGALVNGTEYYLTFDGDAVRDLAGNYYDDDESDAYHFATLDAAVAATGDSDGLSTGEVLAGAAGLGLLAFLIF